MTRLLAILAAIATAFASIPAAAAPAPAVSVNSAGLAAQGYDPVAFFTDGKPVKGSASHQLEWKGARWRFVCRGRPRRETARHDVHGFR